MTNSEIRAELEAAVDEQYNAFNSRIVNSALPTMGVRVPVLRALAVRIAREGAADFLTTYPLKRYEELALRGFVVGRLREVGVVLCEVWHHVQLLESWAACDTFCSSLGWLTKRARPELETMIDQALEAEGEFVRRWGVVMRMAYFLDNQEDAAATLERFERVRCGEYYVNMGVAWGLATALAKAEELTLPLLRDRQRWCDDVWRKAVQKSLESNRISGELKDFLRHTRANALT